MTAVTNGRVLFIGSLGFDDAETSFRAIAESVGNRARRYPDGEPGLRRRWIMWQAHVLDGHPDFLPAEEIRVDKQSKGQLPFQRRTPKPGVNAKDIEFNNVGYADEALRSCRIFRRLKAEGIIPKSVRLQVSLPTPTAFVTTHIQPAYQAEIEPAYEAALRREVARIAGEVAGSELAIQWDVCHEIVAHDGAMELHFDPKIELIADRLSRLCSYVSEDAELGLHFCYGDPGHKHIVEPKDLGTCVELANDLASRAVRRIDWIHMPVPRDRDDDAFFSPLRNLKISPETELYLGLVHMTDGVEGAKRRIATASKFVDDFGIATECGFGRRAPQTVAPLLKLHGQIAEL